MMPLNVSAVYLRHENQDHEDLSIVFDLRRARCGEFEGHDVASFEIGTSTGEIIGQLGPIPMPQDRESAEYEAAVLNFTDDVIRAIDEAEPAILDALRNALEDPILVDGVDVRDHG